MPFSGSACTALVVCGIAVGLLTSVRPGDVVGAAVASAALALLVQSRRAQTTLILLLHRRRRDGAWCDGARSRVCP